jgi:hypothetical protein
MTKEELKKYGESLGWNITEPYQVYTAPWNQGFILKDDTGFDDIMQLTHAQVIHKGENTVFLTRELPDDSLVELYVDGYGHTLKMVSKKPLGLDF